MTIGVHKRDPFAAYWARWKFARLATPLQRKARRLGYALLVHGSLARDIDMVAIPWTEDAAAAEELVAALIKTARRHNDGVAFLAPGQKLPVRKPHGRRCWSIFVQEEHGTYVDLSVMPRRGTGRRPERKAVEPCATPSPDTEKEETKP